MITARIGGRIGPRGPIGPEGQTGAQGEDGADGLPGTGAVPADAAVGGYLGTSGTSASKTAAQVLIATETDIAYVGHRAVAEASPRKVPWTDVLRRSQLIPDGRTKTVLASGGPEQVWVQTGVVVTDDTTRVFPGVGKTQSKRVTHAAAGTHSMRVDPVFPLPAADPWSIGAASVICARYWVEEPTKFTSLEVEIHRVAGGEKWARSTAAAEMVAGGYAPHYGWNLARFRATASTITNWGLVERLNLNATVSAATNWNLDEIWVETPRKGQILIVADRGYKTFKDNGLPDLRTRGIPVTWALDPTLLGSAVGTKNEAVTKADIDTFYAAGDDVSLHAYDGAVTNTKTALEMRLDALQGLKVLQDNGWERGRVVRSAFTQNLAPQAAATKPYFAAYATPSDNSGNDIWPPFNPWNILRVGLHNRSTAFTDDLFTKLQKTHGLLVGYLHGIHTDGITNGGADMTPTEWAYFLTKLDAGIAGGWLEGVTFTQLIDRSNGLVL